MEKVFSVGPRRSYIKRRIEGVSGVGNGSCLRREFSGNLKLGCANKTSCALQLHRDWYNSCAETRCQDTTSED
jgi:hypothetical protein